MTSVVVAGALANKADNGGEAWVRLSWVRGLQRLGLDVWFVEDLGPATRRPAEARHSVLSPEYRRRATYFQGVVEQFGIADRATLLYDGEAVRGPPVAHLVDVAQSAVLVNVSGHLTDERLVPRFRARAFIDLDPGFTQFWYALGDAGARVEGHEFCFTIGENVGTAGSSIPSSNIAWRSIRQPVVIADWPYLPAVRADRFTTVATWRGAFGPVEYGGRTYGSKVHEFRRFLTLPQRSGHHFEIALNIHDGDAKDRRALIDNGWHLTDPAVVATPDRFRNYVQASSAEFSVAQSVYVDTNCGWFSDRSARYLASGRPVLVQDTGFSRHLPTGQGLVAFRTIEEAIQGADRIVRDYAAHAKAARSLAEECFDSDRILARFCEQVGM